MLTVYQYRGQTDDQGTYSRLLSEEVGLDISLIELPDRNNEPQYSRIPNGLYMAIPYNSPKFGKCWMITGIPNRKYVLFHKGNFAGDTRKGWRTHSHGCILPGKTKGFAMYKGRRQKALFNSTSGFSQMVQKIGLNNKFKLVVC